MNHTLVIEKIIHGGLGLGRLESGIVALTPFVLPGEKVIVAEKKKYRGYIQCEPVKILDPSPDRIVPPCPWYIQCGGCDLQHMHLNAQHKVKQEVVRESLTRSGVHLDQHTAKPIIPSPNHLHYRYRIRLKVSPKGIIGFHRAASNEIIEIGSCLIATDMLNNALEKLRGSELLKKIAPAATEIELLQSPSDKQISCIFYISDNSDQIRKAISDLLSPDLFSSILINTGRTIQRITPSTHEYLLRQNFEASICSHSYFLQWAPGSFSQVNAEQNTRLVNLSCQLAGNIAGTETLDLFCGTGNFSIPLALKGAVVTGIERDKECIQQAKQNAFNLGLNDIRFLDRDVQKWIRKATRYAKRYYLIVLDPPRQGMGKNIIHLAEFSPSKIIYISCDPATLARDIGLVTDHGYRLSSVTPVDMFPQTHHVESVALLEKN